MTSSLCLFTVRKRCYLCGYEWDGPSFKPAPLTKTPLPGCCATCNERNEREGAIRRLAARAVPEAQLPDLQRPERVADDD